MVEAQDFLPEEEGPVAPKEVLGGLKCLKAELGDLALPRKKKRIISCLAAMFKFWAIVFDLKFLPL